MGPGAPWLFRCSSFLYRGNSTLGPLAHWVSDSVARGLGFRIVGRDALQYREINRCTYFPYSDNSRDAHARIVIGSGIDESVMNTVASGQLQVRILQQSAKP